MTQHTQNTYRVSLATRHALAELLGKRDNDALRATDETKPVQILVLGDFAHELGAMGGAQARDDVLDVFDGEHD